MTDRNHRVSAIGGVEGFARGIVGACDAVDERGGGVGHGHIFVACGTGL
jgi:hypothetical protein